MLSENRSIQYAIVSICNCRILCLKSWQPRCYWCNWNQINLCHCLLHSIGSDGFSVHHTSHSYEWHYQTKSHRPVLLWESWQFRLFKRHLCHQLSKDHKNYYHRHLVLLASCDTAGQFQSSSLEEETKEHPHKQQNLVWIMSHWQVLLTIVHTHPNTHFIHNSWICVRQQN